MEATSGNRMQGESGIALVMAVLLLLMVSAIGISALNRAGDEKIVAVASRRQVTNLSATEAGLRNVQLQLQDFAKKGLRPGAITLNDQNTVKDHLNRATTVRTGAVGAATVPIIELGRVAGSGEELTKKVNEAYGYRVDITATDPGGGNIQVQAQYVVMLIGGGGGYGN
jgi:Tfp pilus assembly protein PilX